MRHVRPLLLVLVLSSGLSLAAGKGQTLPSFSGRDLNGAAHHSSEYRGQSALMVVMTDPSAADAQRAWFDAADSRLPSSVRRISIISLKLPFYASWDTARGRAVKQVPPEYWGDTLLDRDGSMARALGFDSSPTAYAIALDASGKIVGMAHADPNSPQAESVWSALKASSAPKRR